MIDDQKYIEVLESGLLLDHFFLLCNLKNGVKLVETRRIQGFINLLTKKGYIAVDGTLTEKGIDLVQNCSFAQELVKTDSKGDDFAAWVNELHTKCQEKLVELTGKKQVVARMDGRGKGYSFLPNALDLNKNLYKVMSLYKIKDKEKIEKTILNYIDECAISKSWFPILGYFIIKNGQSQLVTKMESGEDLVENYKSTQKFL